MSRKRNSELTEERIMEAALKLFAEQGYAGTPTSQIATEAGVSEGTIFKYFPKKKDLLSQLLVWFVSKQSHAIIVKPLENIFEENKDAEPKVIFKAIIKDRMGIFDKMAPFIRVLFNEMQYHPELREIFLDKILSEIKIYSEKLLSHFDKSGSVRELPSFLVMRSFIGGTALMIFQRKYLPELSSPEMGLEEEIDIFIDIFLNGILTKGADSNEK